MEYLYHQLFANEITDLQHNPKQKVRQEKNIKMKLKYCSLRFGFIPLLCKDDYQLFEYTHHFN